MVKDNVTNNSVVNEFNIQHEDFPALPGAPGGGVARGGTEGQPPQSSTPNSASIQSILQHPFGSVSTTTDVLSSNNPLASLSQQLSSAINTSSVGSGSSSSTTASGQNPSLSNPQASNSGTGPSTRPASTESISGQQQQPSSQQVSNSSDRNALSGKKLSNTGNTSSGVHITKDGHIANIPPGMLNDHYGMAGLVALLQSTESNQNLFSIAIGCDISTINLNLKSKE